MEDLYITIDAAAILAVAIMLYLTEPRMPTPLPTPPTAEQRIHAMLDDAMQNGYDISTWTADDIVSDLIAFADLNDNEGEAEIKMHVISWKTKRSEVI